VFVKAGADRLQPGMVEPKKCGKQKSKMFWAAFGYGLRTTLVPMDGDSASARGGVTARVYREVLSRHLPPILGAFSIFMHDNAPIHTAHIIRDWLREHGVEVMEWPPYSPDLNPIENIWALLKAEMYRLYPELLGMQNNAQTLERLIQCAITTWDTFEEDIMNRVLDTMPHRVDAVLKANGWYTKY
jgi:hypothetical protein